MIYYSDKTKTQYATRSLDVRTKSASWSRTCIQTEYVTSRIGRRRSWYLIREGRVSVSSFYFGKNE